jgi:hypothetical protein
VLCVVSKDKDTSQDSQHKETNTEEAQRKNKTRNSEHNKKSRKGTVFFFSFPKCPNRSVLRGPFPGLSRPKRKPDSSPQSDTRVRKGRNYYPPVCLHGMDRGTF